MRFSFFATPSTLGKLYALDLTKVLLAGGFNGNWNFGDILQLQGSIRWHRARREHAVIAPLHELSRVKDAPYLRHLAGVFGVEDFLFFTSEPTAASMQQARELGLVPVDPQALKGQASLHVYGGGYFNHFWGHYMVEVVEAVLRAWLPGHYVISGQQISPDFAAEFAAHVQRWHPALVGCRDPLSVKALAEHGLEAKLSGDDALEELTRAAEVAARAGPRVPEPGRFALHMNRSTYTHSKTAGQPEVTPGVEELMNAQLRLLREHLGERATPVVLNAFIDERAMVEDSLTCVRKTDFPVLFPRAEFVDLVGLLLQDHLSQAFERVRGCELLVTSSYHVTLLSKVAGVPAFLGAFNEYYRQKKEGLADGKGSLQDFLASDLAQVAEEGTLYVAQQRELRREWHGALDAILDQALSDVSWMERAAQQVERARSDFEERLRQQEQQTQPARAAADEAQRRCDTQAARLAELERELQARDARVQELQARDARLEQELQARDARVQELQARDAQLVQEKHALQARCDAQEAKLQVQASRKAELQIQLDALLSREPPLRHRLVDGLNDQLKKASGSRAHGAIRRVMEATVGRKK